MVSHPQLPGPLWIFLCLSPCRVKTRRRYHFGWFQLRSQHCLGGGSKVLLLSLITHFLLLLAHLISFLIPIHSKILNLSWPTVSAAAPTPAWDQRGAKSSPLWSLMLVQVRQVSKWLIKHIVQPLLLGQLRQEHSHYLLYLIMWSFLLSP